VWTVAARSFDWPTAQHSFCTIPGADTRSWSRIQCSDAVVCSLACRADLDCDPRESPVHY
jgi:hypothetical protein